VEAFVLEQWSMIDICGREIARIAVAACEEGWYYVSVLSSSFPSELQSALQWYDEVVLKQMLSYLDEALERVARFQLRVRLPDGHCESVHSFQLSPNGEATFRTSPVPLPTTSG
jgi:hypothetical protein